MKRTINTSIDFCLLVNQLMSLGFFLRQSLLQLHPPQSPQHSSINNEWGPKRSSGALVGTGLSGWLRIKINVQTQPVIHKRKSYAHTERQREQVLNIEFDLKELFCPKHHKHRHNNGGVQWVGQLNILIGYFAIQTFFKMFTFDK